MSEEPDQIFPDVDRAKNGYLADKMNKALRTLTTRYVLLSRNFFEVEEMKASKSPHPNWLSVLTKSSCAIIHTLYIRKGLIGDYNYAFLFTPNLPFMKSQRRGAPFFGLEDRMPVVLGLILGLQHALAMLAGSMSSAIIFLTLWFLFCMEM